MAGTRTSRMRISVANANERQAVYRMRHDVYSTELGQYGSRPDGSLPDATDVASAYIIASIGEEVVGFVGITPPNSPRLSVEKHLSRDEIPIVLDKRTFEIRALTVNQSLRGSYTVAGLMYAAFRWVEAHGRISRQIQTNGMSLMRPSRFYSSSSTTHISRRPQTAFQTMVTANVRCYEIRTLLVQLILLVILMVGIVD